MLAFVFAQIKSEISRRIMEATEEFKNKSRAVVSMILYLVLVVIPFWVCGIVFLILGLFHYFNDDAVLVGSFLMTGIASIIISLILFYIGLIVMRRSI